MKTSDQSAKKSEIFLRIDHWFSFFTLHLDIPTQEWYSYRSRIRLLSGYMESNMHEALSLTVYSAA
jgi:hypothetical protein